MNEEQERIKELESRDKSGREELAQLRAARDQAQADAGELQALFDLQHARGIEAKARWQEAHPDQQGTWPDHGDLLVWLMDELDKARAELADEERHHNHVAAALVESRAEYKTLEKEWMEERAESASVKAEMGRELTALRAGVREAIPLLEEGYIRQAEAKLRALVGPEAGKIKSRPVVVCLCGSGRFRQAFEQAEYDETLAAKIVLTIGCNTHDVARAADLAHYKPMLDVLHKRKIDLADEVLILNVGGYIGESTRSELEYAKAHGKTIRFLEPEAGKEASREKLA